MIYPVAVERGSDNLSWGVIVPDLPGCHSASDTMEEALAEVRVAIRGHLSVLADDGDDIPIASSISEFVTDPEYAGVIWALVEIDISEFEGKSEKINITLPRRLISQIDQFVEKNGIGSRSGFLADAARSRIHHGR